MPQVHFSIGSNLGDRRANIDRAIALLGRLHDPFVDGSEIRISPAVETTPWGYISPNRFMNVGMTVATRLSAARLLDETRLIEQSISTGSHREADGSYADRMIDIDIIFYGDSVIDTATLTIPHPRAHLRDFVLIPLCATDPGWVHPVTGQTPSQMLEKIRKQKKD